MSHNKINYDLSIINKINAVQKDLNEQIKQLDNSKKMIENNQSFLINLSLAECISKLEKTFFSLRNLYFFTSKLYDFNVQTYNEEIKKTRDFDIKIQKNSYGYQISLPLTLPKYGEKSKSLLAENLMTELKNFNSKNQIIKFEKAIFIFINNVSQQFSQSQIRDNDNYEYKDIVNSLAFWFLPDDSYKCCNIYNGTKISDTNSTEIYVVSHDNFLKFYQENQNLFF